MTKTELHELVEGLPENTLDGAAVPAAQPLGRQDRSRPDMVLDPRLASWRAGSRPRGKDRPRRGLRGRRRLQGGAARRPQRLVPTYQARPRFLRDYKQPDPRAGSRLGSALDLFIACLRRGRFEPGLRVKRVQGYPGVWELTWAPTAAPPSSTATSCAPATRTSSGDASAHTASSASHKRQPASGPPGTAILEPSRRPLNSQNPCTRQGFQEGERGDSNPRPPGPQLENPGSCQMRSGLYKRFS